MLKEEQILKMYNFKMEHVAMAVYDSEKFSKMLKTIDICCVGGGGAGGSMAFNADYTNLACGGGGGGGGTHGEIISEGGEI